MKVFSFLVILSVLSIRNQSYSHSFIHQIIKGSILPSMIMNFTIFPSNFNGVILYSFDSTRTQFGLHVTTDPDHKRHVTLNLNRIVKNIPLKELCGCHQCENIPMQLYIHLNIDKIYIRCNGLQVEEMYIGRNSNQVSSKEKRGYYYPMPSLLLGKVGKMYVMMGNIGPYTTEANEVNYPIRAQMFMCLVNFLFNHKYITFIEGDSKVKSLCHWKCNGDICNQGVCKERQYDKPICDCHSVALNGPYCNKSLSAYSKSLNNTFEKIANITKMYLKMTWKTTSWQSQCLMNIVMRDGQVTLIIKDQRFILASNLISHYVVGEVNFFTVNVTSFHFIIKSSNKELQQLYTLDSVKRVNIGFSEEMDTCKTFEGEFDLSINASQLQSVSRLRVDRTNVTTTKPAFILGVPIIVFPIIISVVIVILRRRFHHRNSNVYDSEPIELDNLTPNTADIVDQHYSSLDTGQDLSVVEDKSSVYYVLPSNTVPSRPLPEPPDSVND